MNRADLLYEVLKDGKPHSRRDIQERVGYFLTNNAASELRARLLDQGLDVLHSRPGRVDTYQIVDLLDGGRGAAAPSIERVGTDGERRQSARSYVSAPGGGASPLLSAAPSAADDSARVSVVPEPSLVPGQLSIDEVAA